MSASRKFKILVVDDEPDITTVIKSGLETEGFIVDTFNDPEEAIEKFEAQKYDLVLSDIQMPKMTGFDLYRELIKLDEKIKVCFFTAFEIYYGEFTKLFPTLKVNCFVRKPVSIAKLAELIKQELVDLEVKQKI